MASPTQTVVSKGISNSLTTEDLLKILGDLVPSSLQNLLPILSHGMVGPQKNTCVHFSDEMSKDLSCNNKPLTSHFCFDPQ